MKEQWLLLLHQIPPKPPYFRAQVLRRLVQAGALPVKNSAYLLPDREETVEDFEWICQEIIRQGGAAWLFRAETIAGMSSDQIKAAFRELRLPEYEELIQIATALLAQQATEADDTLSVHRKILSRYEQLKRLDFFDCPARTRLKELIGDLESRLRSQPQVPATTFQPGRVWVTRKGIKVDRIASAWLIRRFVDPHATFRFVDPGDYRHSEPELRFDMFEGEYTHQGDLCTFEVLVAASNLEPEHPALRAIGEIIHDIDLKDERYQRPETAGVDGLIKGLCAHTAEDEVRLQSGSVIFDSLYQSFAA